MVDLISPFIALTAFLGVRTLPPPTTTSFVAPEELFYWETSGWACSSDGCSLRSQTFLPSCPAGNFLVAPAVIHAAHTFSARGRVVLVHGDPTGRRASPFYTQPVVPCALIPAPTSVVWEVRSHTSFFARVPRWPEVRAQPPWQNLFFEPMQAAAALTLLSLSMFAAVAYGAKDLLVSCFCTSSLAFAVYFAASSAPVLYLNLSPLEAHRWADIAIWVAIVYAFTIFRARGLLCSTLYGMTTISSIVAVVLMSHARTGDDVQAATMLPFAPALLAAGQVAVGSVVRVSSHTPTRRTHLEAMAAFCFVLAGCNEIFVVLGITPESPTILQTGACAMLLFLAVALHEDYSVAVAERESLRRERDVSRLETRVAYLQAELTTAQLLVHNKIEAFQSRWGAVATDEIDDEHH